MPIVAVDIFCGAGGLTHGLEKAGVRVAAGFDADGSCRYAFEANNRARFIESDVEQLTADDVRTILPRRGRTAVVGCAPCQPFSTYRLGKRSASDRRWNLLDPFGRLIVAVGPDLVSMENVPALERQDVFERFVGRLRRNHYKVWHEVVQAADYGVPQLRRRLILLASRHGKISLIAPTHPKRRTVAEAIAKLDPLGAGEESLADPMHCTSGLSQLNLKRIRASRPGGTWRDWPKRLVADCHTRGHGVRYPSVYGRMRWDEPAPTITTECYAFGSGRFGHPEQDRALSLREAAILQSFPKSYQFFPPGEPIALKQGGRMIGNAVPVLLGTAIGLTMNKHRRQHGG